MANLTFKHHWMMLALVLPAFPPLAPSSTSLFPHVSPLQYYVSSSSDPQQRRPRRQLGGRGGVCAVSPGLLEQQNMIWSDRPLFVWNALPKVTMQKLEVIDQTERLVWEKPLAATDKTARYDGQPLQPGQPYTWKLYWRLPNAESSADYDFQLMEVDHDFQLMEVDQRNQITADLQSLTRQLPHSQLNSEALAAQQVDYLLNRAEPLWSDALQVLYSIDNPSNQTTQQIQDWISTACGQEEN